MIVLNSLFNWRLLRIPESCWQCQRVLRVHKSLRVPEDGWTQSKNHSDDRCWFYALKRSKNTELYWSCDVHSCCLLCPVCTYLHLQCAWSMYGGSFKQLAVSSCLATGDHWLRPMCSYASVFKLHFVIFLCTRPLSTISTLLRSHMANPPEMPCLVAGLLGILPNICNRSPQPDHQTTQGTKPVNLTKAAWLMQIVN